MIIKAKNREIDVLSVIADKIQSNGKSYPALKFVFGGAVTKADIEALASGEIHIGEYVHEGYNTLGEIAVTVGKITTAEQERDAAEAEKVAAQRELSTTRAAHEEYKGTVKTILPILDDKTALSVKTLFPTWEVGNSYTVDERFIYNDVMYRVVQDHTSQADWTPDVTASLYDEVKVSDSGYDVWSQPTGSHDAYNKGDIVEYNGTLYKSLIDGNTYAPDAYPDGWEVYTA